jgi:hypothetical protein
MKDFIKLAGGNDAPIIVIPNGNCFLVKMA